jgi:uncharacterized membrane protein YebE (DUF533 family)
MRAMCAVSRIASGRDAVLINRREMKLRITIALVIAIAAALAAVGGKASWKWSAGSANAHYNIAAGDLAGTEGWSWGDD